MRHGLDGELFGNRGWLRPMTCELSDATTVVKTGFKKRRFRGNLKVCSALMSLKKTPVKVLQQDTQNICQGLMYHWQILLSHSAR